jgi:hypothetical protein
MWRELVAQLYPDHTFRPGATERVLTATERRLGHRLPRDLRGLLSESDGVHGEFDLGLVWPAARIVEDNLRMRTGMVPGDAFMPFDPLLFFGDAGNGDCFAFPLVSAPRDQNVFAWDHEDDSRSWVAPDLRRFLEWWADGRIRL